MPQSTHKPLPKRTVKRYGWRPDLPDTNDRKYHSVMSFTAAPVPDAYDLTKSFKLPACYDQGALGSCTGNGCGFLWQFANIREGQPAPMPSRLFIYYGERVIEGTVMEDSGAQIRDGMKVLNKWGCCDEKFWPYAPRKFTNKPPLAVYREAEKHQAIQYFRVKQSIAEIKRCIGLDHYPIVFGFSVYESFEGEEVARTGVVPMPVPKEESVGGHCVVIVGYDDATRMFKIRNSWGPEWAKDGYFFMPYDYVLNPDLAEDFWTLRMVEAPGAPLKVSLPDPEPVPVPPDDVTVIVAPPLAEVVSPADLPPA